MALNSLRIRGLATIGLLVFVGSTGCVQTSRRSEAVPASPTAVPAKIGAPRATEKQTDAGGGVALSESAAPAGDRVVSEPAPPMPVREAPPSSEPAPLGQDEYTMLIESEPSGATVVVNGKPCGRTPYRLVLAATRRGFLREAVSVKVRFIATSETQASQTVEAVLTTLDKVPAALRFTSAGAERVVR